MLNLYSFNFIQIIMTLCLLFVLHILKERVTTMEIYAEESYIFPSQYDGVKIIFSFRSRTNLVGF